MDVNRVRRGGTGGESRAEGWVLKHEWRIDARVMDAASV